MTPRQQMFAQFVAAGMERALNAIARVERRYSEWAIVAEVFEANEELDKCDPYNLPVIRIRAIYPGEGTPQKPGSVAEFFPIGLTVERMEKILIESIGHQDRAIRSKRFATASSN